jgi:hypothetical protein
VHQCAFEMIDEFLADPDFARFAFAGIAIVVRQRDVPNEPDKVDTDLAIRVAPGPHNLMRRALLRIVAERLPRVADEVAKEDEAAAREIIERIHREASKN